MASHVVVTTHPNARDANKSLSENRLGEGDSPILLQRLRKIGTVPGGFRIGCTFWQRSTAVSWKFAAEASERAHAAAFSSTTRGSTLVVKKNRRPE
jgi:hypothetical protein